MKLVLVLVIVHLCAGGDFNHWLNPPVTRIRYHVYQGRIQHGYLDEPHDVYTVNGFNACMYKCPLTDARCAFMAVERQPDASFRCLIFSHSLTSKPIVLTENIYPNTIYLITKQPLTCSGSCRKLKNLCERRCQCMDGCSEPNAMQVLPYVCDCRNTDLVKKDCMEFRNLGFYNSGMYLINPDEGPTNIQVFCEMRDNGSAGPKTLERDCQTMPGKLDPKICYLATITMFRRFHPLPFIPGKQNIYDGGIGDPSRATLWLALRHVHRITQGSAQRIRATATGFDGSVSRVIWKHFSLADESDLYRLSIADYNDFGTGLENLFEGRDGNTWGHIIKKELYSFWRGTPKTPMCCEKIYLRTEEGGEFSRIELSLETAASGPYVPTAPPTPTSPPTEAVPPTTELTGVGGTGLSCADYAVAFCVGNDGNFPYAPDNTVYVWCYGSGQACMPCGAGTTFCTSDPSIACC